MMFSWQITLLCLFIYSSNAAPSGDLISNLPGLNFLPSFQHYSGYLQATKTHFLHYWFTLSQNNPTTDPVVLWLSGGPGCSSVDSLLEELGPFHIRNNGSTVYENVYAWNKIANVIFLESPVGVGYSYTTDGNITSNDDMTAKDNHNALVDFFRNKFPEFASNDFYITGESYAGVYLPTLGVLLMNDKQNFPTFKGLAVGNPLLSYSTDTNSLFPFLYNHGIISVLDWSWLGTNCCSGNPNTCNFYSIMNGNMGSACAQKAQDITSSLYNMQHWNPYNLYFACYLPSSTNLDEKKIFGSTKHDLYRKMITKHFGIKMDKISRPTQDATVLPLCAQYRDSIYYMNRQDVKAALHIPASLPAWDQCNFALNEKYYHTQYADMSTQLKQLVAGGIRVVVYNGDVDAICNVMGNQQFSNQLNLPLVKDKTLWTYAHDIPDAAGFVTSYQGYDFVTVRGAGHFCPLTRARETLQLLANFIRKKPYSNPSNINVTPKPLIVNACSSNVLPQNYFGGPVKAASLCGRGGTCLNTPNGGAKCSCSSGFSGPFCNQYTPTNKAVPIQLCAAYPTPMTTAQGLPFGCPQTYTCVPYQYRCVTTLSCNYPIGYCLPWVHLNSMFPSSMSRKLKILEQRTSKSRNFVSHFAKKNKKLQN